MGRMLCWVLNAKHAFPSLVVLNGGFFVSGDISMSFVHQSPSFPCCIASSRSPVCGGRVAASMRHLAASRCESRTSWFATRAAADVRIPNGSFRRRIHGGCVVAIIKASSAGGLS